MANSGTLLRCEEALRLIEQTENLVTKKLLTMAFVKFVKSIYFEKKVYASCDVDMLYVVTVLKDFLSEHDILARTLAGEKFGEWFDEES